jgi:hypothetical protein
MTTTLWIDEDASYMGAVRTLLRDQGRGVHFAASVERGLKMALYLKRVPLVMLDAIVPVWSGNVARSGESSLPQEAVDTLPCDLTPGTVREQNGWVFIENCRKLGIELGSVAVVSFVPESLLRTSFGYQFDHYFGKLSLPDRIKGVRDLIMTASADGARDTQPTRSHGREQ